MKTDIEFTLPGGDEEVVQETVTVNTTSLEEDLAALQLDDLPKPLMKTRCLHTDTEPPQACTGPFGTTGPGLQPRPSHRQQLWEPGLPRLDSTSSMRSLLTDSGTTNDSCPPSPQSSAHFAEPPYCGSWTLDSYQIGNIDQSHGRHMRSSSYTGGRMSSIPTAFSFAPSISSDDDLSRPPSEYGSKVFSACSSKSSVHDFSRFTDEDREQGSSVQDDSYDLLIEAICNVVTTRLTENDLRKLKAPLTHYANVFVESIARDLGDWDPLRTRPADGSEEDVSATSVPVMPNTSFSFRQESNQGRRSEQNNFEEGLNDDGGSPHLTGMDEHQMARNARNDESALSCPFRKRNPIKFNVRSHSSCALSHFPSINHLKRHIKAFHSNSGEQCRRCWAWFETTEDLFDHMTQSVACELRRTQSRDSEDGISPALLQKICDKRVQTWNDIWLILFPDLDQDVPQPEFDPPVELDEVESTFYGTDTIEGLHHGFQQIALDSPHISPWESFQRALKESAKFLASTLQSCRELQGHTPSSSRDARTHEFLERVQYLSSEEPQFHHRSSGILASRSHFSPRSHRQSNDSGIASHDDSDIDVNIPWKPLSVKPEKDRPKLRTTFSPLINPLCLPRGQNDAFNATSFGLRGTASFETHRLSSNPPRSSDQSFDPTRMTKQILTMHCVCRGGCSWCHTAECKPPETGVNQWCISYPSVPRPSPTGDDEDPCCETVEGKDPATWVYCRDLCHTPQESCDQRDCIHDEEDVLAETPGTETSTPDSHFPSAQEDYDCTEDDEVHYEQLVENITNLVLKSKWTGHAEDRCMPIVKFTHAYLENIRCYEDGLGFSGRLPVATASPCADSEDPDSNIGSQELPGLFNTNGKRERGAGRGHHRKRDEGGDGDPNRDDPDDFSDPENFSGDRKRVRIGDIQKFPCPYRKRHPTRFNIREYHQCALNTFATMALLKRHIKLFHTPDNNGPSCVRCHRCFQTNEDYREHLLQESVCEIRSGQDDSRDPEDGLSAEKCETLAKRSKNEKVDTWDALWKLLFPADHAAPRPHYEEPIELEEVQEKCYNEESITRFFQRLTHPTHEDGYRYIVKTFKKIRKAFKHQYCDKRRQTDCRFLEQVRKRASTSHDLLFSQKSSNVQLQDASHTDSQRQLLGVPPGLRRSSIYSVPEMIDTPNTGGSSNNATETTCAMTPASSWHQIAEPSELPAITRSTSGYFGSSGEDMSYQEQLSFQGDSQKHSFPQFHSPSESCRHQIEVGTYCGECAEELAPFFPPGDVTAYPGEHLAGEDGSTMDQDQVIWAQNAPGK